MLCELEQFGVALFLLEANTNTGAALMGLSTPRKRAPVAHIRFDGRSLDVPLAELGVAEAAADQDFKRAIARYLEAPVERLQDHVLDRHETGNVTLRPAAVFG